MAKLKKIKPSAKNSRTSSSHKKRSKTPPARSSHDESKYPSIEKILRMPAKSSKLNVSGAPVLRQTTINSSTVTQYDERDIVQNLSNKISELMDQNADPDMIQKMQNELKKAKSSQKERTELEQSNIAKVNQIQENSITSANSSPMNILETPMEAEKASDSIETKVLEPQSDKPSPDDRSPTPPRGSKSTNTPRTNVAQAQLNDALEKLTPFNRFSKMQEKAKLNRAKAIQKAKETYADKVKNMAQTISSESENPKINEQPNKISPKKKAASVPKKVIGERKLPRYQKKLSLIQKVKLHQVIRLLPRNHKQK